MNNDHSNGIRTFRRVAVALAIAVVAGYPLAASAQAPTRAAQALPGLGGSFSIAHDINESGIIVGEASNAAGQTHAVSWTNGVIRDLGTLGGNSSRALGVSNRGQIVGSSLTATGVTRAFIWDQGVMTQLPVFFDSETVSEANDVNDNGIAVGFSTNSSVYWQNGQINLLPGAGGSPNRASRISGGNVVVGTVVSASGSFNSAVIWRLPNLQSQNIGTLPGGNQSFGFDVNDSIQVAGTSTINPSGSPVHAFLWTNGVRLDLGTLISGPSASSQGFGLSTSGLVCGEGSALDAGGNATTHGLLWDYNHQVVNLLPLAGNSFSTANAVNSGGVAVGHSSSPTAPRAVFWRF
jgi:probable HAF family extracellular repeat protein